ncbi:MAG TPA: RNA methyltransferase [Candidatus Moranbacteria bacterium]|nr:MAG: tRNA/rRNA methyltransferase [Candidatus Moranbacteria bacterium GW2011_GWC2_45_10]KKT95105.1 MAG: tRNA/rRNA methyltransferase (SpoU) [Parcubacteria group bacterium GW2011_GWC1_45_14]HAV11264.1 RNA methyltransferase [Candidatus Moranbacteria bacterium]
MKLIVIAHNIRSAHNIGSIFRTADGVGAAKIYLTGYSPSPAKENAPYLTDAQKMIAKTALGAEKNVEWEKAVSIGKLLEKLKKEGVKIVALEQDEESIDYGRFVPQSDVALIVGNEPKGIDKRILKKCDAIVEIPMRGKKKSLNVSVAFGVVAYEICGKIK